jgi:hypothetical protein
MLAGNEAAAQKFWKMNWIIPAAAGEIILVGAGPGDAGL